MNYFSSKFSKIAKR